MQLHLSVTLLAVLLVAAGVSTSEAASCSTKTIYWGKSGHNEDCKDTCMRYGKRKAIKSGDALLCADYDGENFDNPLPTDWVSGSFRDIAKDPFNAQKQCWIHRKYFDPGENVTSNPIASSSNFYCGCWKETPACSKYKPKWIPHSAANGKPIDQATCKDVCISKSMVVADRTPESYEYICRYTGDMTKSTMGYEHYDGPSNNMMCHFVQYDKVNDEEINVMNNVYECLCQKKFK